VITGFFAGSINFGGGALTSAGADDIFLVKLDADGGHVFSKAFGDAEDQQGFDTFDTNTWTSLDMDAAGNIYLGGPLVGSATFGLSPISSPNGRMDAFVAKFTSAGTHRVSNRYGDGGTQIALDLAADDNGHVVLVGRFYSSTMDFDPASGSIQGIGVNGGVSSGGDGFVVKLAID